MRSAIAILVFVVCSFAASRAWAGELQFAVVEDAGSVTLQVRGFDGATPKKVITSRTGMLFFFEASKAKTTRLRPAQKHRIAYAQVGQTGNRVALRIAQRERARGALGTFVSTQEVSGGLDIEIIDKDPSEVAAPPVEAPTQVAETEEAEDTQERTTALAALEASLGTQAPVKEDTAEKPVAEEPEVPEEEAVAAIAPELEAPELPTEPEPAPAATGSAALRSLLAVALLLAFGGGAIWWIKRRKRDADVPVLDVVSRVGVGPKQSVILINAGGRQLLIGATEKRIEVLTELSPTQELRVPSSVLDRPREPFATPRVPIAAPTDPTAPAKIAAFKARLEQALGRELTGEHPLVEESAPPHLRLLTSEPRWNEEGVA